MSVKATKAPIVKKQIVKEEIAAPKVEITAPEVEINVQGLDAKLVKKEEVHAPPPAIEAQPIITKPQNEGLPFKSGVSMVTSRLELEQEIERQFGFAINITKDSQLLGDDIAMKEDDAFYSQPVPVQETTRRYEELKKKFASANKQQYKFTPTFSQVLARNGS